METAQSPHIPAPGKKPGLKDAPWLAYYGLRGLAELVRARLAFARLKAKHIPDRNARSRARAEEGASAPPAALARISYVIPRISDRLPWRSDCLIQAIAAQNWLSALGEASEIQIGVENPRDSQFGAHAWLLHRNTVITGGDIDRYDVILSDSRLDAKRGADQEAGKPR